MTLTSGALLLGLIAFVSVFWLLPRPWQMPGATVAALGWLGFFAPWSALCLVAITGASYLVARRPPSRWGFSLVCVFALVASFFGLKATLLASEGFIPDEVLLFGFSFYVLRAIHYLVEHMKGTLPPHGWAQYAAYMGFLPTLAIGPIHRFGSFLRECDRRRWDSALFSAGLERILYGYVKVVVLANFLVTQQLGAWLGTWQAPAQAHAYLSCLQYGLNLYFQFSGYSDIAIGLALVMGIRLGENFNHPLLRTNIGAFWSAWHISLSSWCRDYVYTPLLGWRRLPILAVFATMLAVAMWHEVSVRYMLWGLYHAVGIAVWQQFQVLKPRLPQLTHAAWRRPAAVASWALTFNFVMVGFAITKEPDVAQAVVVLQTILTGGG